MMPSERGKDHEWGNACWVKLLAGAARELLSLDERKIFNEK